MVKDARNPVRKYLPKLVCVNRKLRNEEMAAHHRETGQPAQSIDKKHPLLFSGATRDCPFSFRTRRGMIRPWRPQAAKNQSSGGDPKRSEDKQSDRRNHRVVSIDGYSRPGRRQTASYGRAERFFSRDLDAITPAVFDIENRDKAVVRQITRHGLQRLLVNHPRRSDRSPKPQNGGRRGWRI